MSCDYLRSFGFQDIETDIENKGTVNNVKAYKWNV